MSKGCSHCNGRGVGFAPYLFADDGIEERINGVNPQYAVLPAVVPSTGNLTAALVGASIGAQVPTNSNALKPSITDDSVKVKVGASLTAARGQVLYFSDDEQPYRPSAAVANAAVEPAQASSKLVKYGTIGVVGYLAWKLLGG